MLKVETSIVGQGWSFPPTFSKGLTPPQVELVGGETDIEQSLGLLLSTRLGERIMDPDYGSDLSDVIFETADLSLQTRLEEIIAGAILNYESRITVNNVAVDMSQRDDGVVRIGIDYTINSTNSRSNIVFPFVKVEGTLVSDISSSAWRLG